MIDSSFGYPIEAVLVLCITFCISLYVDFIGHKNGHTMSIKEAVIWSIAWITIACGFGIFLLVQYGGTIASMYFAGYIVEKTLSIDNIIVFTAIFSSFGITEQALQHKILLWGIASAIILRAVFTFLGANILALHWSFQLVFAAIIAFSAFSMLTRKEEETVDYKNHSLIRYIKKFFPLTESLHEDRFFIKKERLYMTPAFVCLCIIELSDVLFAFDSVPAVFAITKEPFLVYAAMLFAIMGLRSLYFVLQRLLTQLIYLEKAIIILLFFIAGKMSFAAFDMHLPLWISLSTILGIITIGILCSIFFAPQKKGQ